MCVCVCVGGGGGGGVRGYKKKNPHIHRITYVEFSVFPETYLTSC